MLGQGAVELNGVPFNCRHLAGQGATEYLVIFAVVLLVAVVVAGVMGFFPLLAADASLTRSQSYWASATPVSIVEWGAMDWGYGSPDITFLYIRVKNNGPYPITITKILGRGNWTIDTLFFWDSDGYYHNISDYYYLLPGEEKYFAAGTGDWVTGFTVPEERGPTMVYLETNYSCSPMGGPGSIILCSADKICNGREVWTDPLPDDPGYLYLREFGFEFIEHLEDVEITRRQVGIEPVYIKCINPPDVW